jgi:hypothetical protein
MWILTLAVLTGMVGDAPAQDRNKPLAVVSYAGYDRAMKTLEFIGQLAGKPEMAAGMEQMLKMMTGGQGLQGLDPQKPWGVVVRTEGSQIDGYAFFPVSDLKQLLTALTPLVGPATETGGMFKIERGAQTFYAKKQGSWAFVANKESQLSGLPDAPDALLGELPKDYLWAARLFVANLPADLRDRIVAQVQAVTQMIVQQNQGPEQEVLRSRMQQSLAQLERAAKELDQITLGLEIDRQARKAHLDLQITALPGTKAATDLAAAEHLKTDYAGFMESKATVRGNWNAVATTPPSTEELNKQIEVVRKQALEQLESVGLTEEDLKTLRQILDDVLDVARQTAATGRIDGGALMVLDPTAATAVVGGRIAAGAKLNAALKRLADLATKTVPDTSAMIKMDAGTLAGMHLHTASIPLPPDIQDREKLVKIVGENLDVAVAVGDESAFFALGRNALATLKQVVEQSQAQRGKSVQPLQVTVAFVPLVRFIAEIGDEQTQQNFRRLYDLVKPLAGKDAVRVTAGAIPRGMQVRLEVEEAVLKAAAMSSPIGGPAVMPSP